MSAIHVFIDSNVFLSLYHYTKNDNEQLRIIAKLIKKKQLTLYLTRQVVDEYKRNREGKLAQAIKDFAGGAQPLGVPRCMNDYIEAKEYQDAVKEMQKARNTLISHIEQAAEKQELSADLIFQEVCAVATTIEQTEAVLNKANLRKTVGNPPGKGNSIGDQINWESLLAEVPSGADLHVVSKDGDFASTLLPRRPKQFLIDEWKSLKNANLHLHEELRPFLKTKFPLIKVAIDVEKATAIEQLETSRSFATTHAAIGTLSPLTGALTWSEADRIFTVGLENKQIWWIGTDNDVSAFYTTLMESFKGMLDTKRKAELENKFSCG